MTGRNASQRRAFVFGNAAMDEVFLVRDLPVAGASVLGTAGHTGLGGKGANQAIALARTGVPTTLVAAVGCDWHGREIRAALSREPLGTALLERADLPTDRSIVFAQANGDNVIVTTNACAASATLAECLSVLETARAGDAVLLQGNLAVDVTAALCHECARRGLFLVLNPSPFDAALGELVPLADALFVNQTEAHGLTGLPPREAVDALLRAGASQVVLTLGAEGSLLGSKDGVVRVPAETVEVVDVTGAGDCFEGVAVGSALLRGSGIDVAALRHASRAAADTIGAVGAAGAFPDAARIAALIAETPAG
ncbi:ribokinase [Roseibacterium sp. SDUM158017]|uniref:ribokinase n=1 Tax=Roseicyclus salinarum TaxID=3036773 RepID=UPI00241559FC|nr:ribokinase [Roseibacterium sp. SDUM158017]MDG4647487.1 ribokinase [Roseibacterium sp. SDUM158017]